MGDYKDIENQLKDFWEKEPTKVDGEMVFTIGKYEDNDFVFCIIKVNR